MFRRSAETVFVAVAVTLLVSLLLLAPCLSHVSSGWADGRCMTYRGGGLSEFVYRGGGIRGVLAAATIGALFGVSYTLWRRVTVGIGLGALPGYTFTLVTRVFVEGGAADFYGWFGLCILVGGAVVGGAIGAAPRGAITWRHARTALLVFVGTTLIAPVPTAMAAAWVACTVASDRADEYCGLIASIGGLAATPAIGLIVTGIYLIRVGRRAERHEAPSEQGVHARAYPKKRVVGVVLLGSTFVVGIVGLVVVLVGSSGRRTATTSTAPFASQSVVTSPSTTTTLPYAATVSTATASTTTASTTTTLSADAVSGITLRGDGLGIVTFGDPMDEVVAVLIDALGEPSLSRVLEAPFSSDGSLSCFTASGTNCFDYLRVLAWDNVGLTVLVSDWTWSIPPEDDEAEPQQAPPNLRGYEYRGGSGAAFETLQGITIGSNAAELIEAFGPDQVIFYEDDCTSSVSSFRANPTQSPPTVFDIWGALDALVSTPSAAVASIGAGSYLSCY